MAQTTNAKTFIKASVRASTTGAAPWTDISGHGASIAVGGGDRAIGKQATFDGDTPIVGAGKRDSMEVTCRFVYTETAAEPFDYLLDAYEVEGAPLCLQYAPLGHEVAGNYFSTGVGIIKSFGYPQGEAGDGAILMGEVVVTCAALSCTSGSWSGA